MLRKPLYLLLANLILILVFIFLVDVVGNCSLYFYRDEIKREIHESTDLDLDFRKAYFEFFRGVVINDINLSRDSDHIASVKSVILKPDYIDIILYCKFFVKGIVLKEAHLYRNEKKDDNFLLGLASLAGQGSSTKRSVKIVLDKINIMDYVTLDTDGSMVFGPSGTLLLHGKLNIISLPFLKEAGFPLSVKDLGKVINYVVEVIPEEDGFVVRAVDIVGYDVARLIGFGKVKDAQGSLNVDVDVELRNMSVDNFYILDNRNLDLEGLINATFKMQGPIATPSLWTEINLNHCRVRSKALNFHSVESKVSYSSDEGLDAKLSGILNRSLLSLSLKKESSLDSPLALKISIDQYQGLKSIKLDFMGNISTKLLEGDIGFGFDYREYKEDKSAFVDIKNAHLEFNDLTWSFGGLDLIFSQKKESQRINSTNLGGSLKPSLQGIALHDFTADIYGGKLRGSAIFDRSGSGISHDIKIDCKDLVVGDFVRDFLSLDYSLAGILSGSIHFSSEKEESVSGEAKIVKGKIENNEILKSIADFFSVPSLENIDFSSLNFSFNKIGDIYSAQVTLDSDNIWLDLNNQFAVGHAMDGYLTIKIATELMNESSKFKRLFKYIGYNEPMVYFPFKFEGYAHSPRIEWLQNEFREKLGGFLPEGSKKVLQRELNRVIDEFVE
ncbi:hypothetical protein ACFL96_08280 [Thermoproteota archaeon]